MAAIHGILDGTLDISGDLFMTQIIPRDSIDHTEKCGIYTDAEQSYILIVSPAQETGSASKLAPQQIIIENGQISIRHSSIQNNTLVWEKWIILTNPRDITSDQLTDSCIITSKLADGAVITDKLQNKSITEDKLSDVLKNKIDSIEKSRYSAVPYNTGEKWINGQDVWRADFAVVVKDDYQADTPDDKMIHIEQLVNDPALNINGTSGIIDIQAYSASAFVDDPRQEHPFIVDLCMIDIQQVKADASGWLYFYNQYQAACNAVLLYGHVKYVKDYTLNREHVTGIIDGSTKL